MYNVNRVYDLATFLQAVAYNFAEIEGDPPDEDPPGFWPVIRLEVRPRTLACA